MLKMKLEMAKFLQDTIEDSAVVRKHSTGESTKDFVEFMEKVRVCCIISINFFPGSHSFPFYIHVFLN